MGRRRASSGTCSTHSLWRKCAARKVKVSPTLNLPDHPEVFVIGDMAYLEGYKGGQAYPQVAPVAIQQGKWAAENILRQAGSRKMRPFHYFDKGNLATIGRSYAIMDAFGFNSRA